MEEKEFLEEVESEEIEGGVEEENEAILENDEATLDSTSDCDCHDEETPLDESDIGSDDE